MPAISVKNLQKTFTVRKKEPGFLGSVKNVFKPTTTSVHAVNNVSFNIEEGELVGFIGPNGAGKSTTIKMLTGILHPTRGEIKVLGHVPQNERVTLAYKIGTIFGQRQQLLYHLPAADSFHLFSKIYELDEKKFQARLQELVKVFDIEDLLQTPVRKLSLGQRMRCEFVASLLHAPKVLFLDEPTIGLDILAKRNIREYIKKLNREEGTTIILTSHDLEDIEELCPRVVVINHGKILYDGSMADMRKKLKYKIIEIYTDDEIGTVPVLQHVKVLEKSKFKVVLRVNHVKTPIRKVLDKYLTNYQVADILIEDPPIESVIERLYT